MKKNFLKLILLSLILIILISIIILIFFNPFIKIKLKGNKSITLEVNNEYKEPGITISGTKNKYKTIGNVNTKKLGKYTITYKINFLKTTKKTTRTINVVDKIPPVITLNNQDIILYQDETFSEPGYEVTDNYDKNVKITIDGTVNTKEIGEYTLTYTAMDSSANKSVALRKVIVKKKEIKVESGITYINGIMLVNKKYALPSTYNPGVNATANQALKLLQAKASESGHSIPLISGFRSYSRQKTLYNNYVARDGVAKADTYSARPGHSEHQSGLAFDVGAIDDNYGNTPAGTWLKDNCHKYGFIIRYLKGKEHITGYKYEPWHIRYVGVEHATKIYNQQLTLEEYLGVA